MFDLSCICVRAVCFVTTWRRAQTPGTKTLKTHRYCTSTCSPFNVYLKYNIINTSNATEDLLCATKGTCRRKGVLFTKEVALAR